MSIKEHVLEWDTVRKQPASAERTAECTRIVSDLEKTINNHISKGDVPWSTSDLHSALQSESTGTRVAGLLIVKALFDRWPENDISNVINCVIDCLNPGCELYIQDITRGVLRVMFRTPWIRPYTGEQLAQIYKHLYMVKVPPEDRDSEKREKFTHTIGMFFDQAFYLMPKFYRPEVLVDRLKGSLVGMALGDALGFLVEGFPREHAMEYVDNVIKAGMVSQYGVHVGYGRDGPRYRRLGGGEIAYKFGQYTDDTQCCRELLLSILESNGKFKAKNYAAKLVSLFGNANLLRYGTKFEGGTTGIVGYGTTTKDSVQRLADGIPWELAGSSSAQGNGGCMRIAPLGVFYMNRPESLAKVASNQCAGTHASSRARATAVLVAEATRLACESSLSSFAGHDLEKFNRGFCERIANSVQRYDKGVAQAVLGIPVWIADWRQEAWSGGEVYANEGLIIKASSKGAELGDKSWHHGNAISCYAVQTALFAVCCFLAHPKSYFDTVCMAISAGGDTDTTAAIAGAISGAYLGLDSIPKDAQFLSDAGYWNRDALIDLCDKLQKYI